ncbi:Neurogenic locus notch -like protein 2 [Trichinella pseudospiralis]|uniref:Neurogenic locus notch-like protein 2 n=1 Tax=Trichinella pseudospiralis TaxID=6337 RepID=A0A0V1FC20_TRIPS|nr:Neurogenic locus notch -like protein 2 [Trichinella pseudospiralis]
MKFLNQIESTCIIHCINDMKSSKLVQKDSFQQSGNEEILLSAHLRKEHPKENSYNQGKDAENSFLLNNKKLKRKYNLIIALLLSFILFQYLWYIICLLRQLYNDTHQESRSLYSNSSVDLTFKSGYIVLYDDFYLKNNSQAEEKYEAEIKKAVESASLSNSNCTTKTERIRYFKRKNGILSALVAIDVHLNINRMEQNFSNFLEKFQTVLLKSNPAWNLIDIKFENFSNPILSKFNNSVIMSHMTSLLSKEKLTNDDSQEQSFETFNYIHSNGFPGRYLPNTDHSWEIINPDEQDGQVQLKILALNLAYDQHTKSCSDYIEIYIHNTLHSRLCQIPTNPMQRTIISMFNDVKIRFVSKDHQDYENFGFLIEWQFNQVPCVPNPCANGGVCSRDKFGFVSCVCPSGYNGTFCDVATNCNTPVLTDIEGSIVTPNLYLGYQSGSSCNWLIRAPFNHIIHVTTLSFFLNDPKICSDYIRINDYSPFADDLGTHSKRFCGSDISSKFISKYDTIEIQFAAESNDQFPGAAFKYKIAPNYCLLNPCNSFQDCFNTADGYICQCKPGRVGEDCSRSKFYSLNYLKCAYKVDFCFSHPCKKPGTDECINLNETFFCKCSAGYSGSLCELSACDFHPTCKNNGICLVNDAGLAACKCKANFTGYDCSSVRCNDIFDEETGSLSSPSFPVDGSSTFQCQYRFIAKDRKGFLFNFKNVKLRSTYFDNVYIFSSWNTIDNDMIYSFNGIRDDFEISVRASKALILLSGSADPMENNYGFELQYSSTFACDDLHSGCASKETCISFNESIAHVSGEDNTNADYKKENDFCNPNPCKNNGKCISLANDFKCQCPPYYFAGKRCEIINCQNIRLDSKFGFIVPPGYPNEYVPNLNCSWIFALNETTMEYTFQSLMFNVEGPQNRCSNDYLEFDSAEDHSRKMRACGVLESAALQLEYPNPLIVRFVTDEDVEEDGFFINYRHQMKGKCNETLKSKYGDIFLPDKSILEQFQGNVCTWTFESSIGGFVDLYIERFKSNDCQKNYLQILDVDINGKNEIICETSYKRIKSPQNKFVINVFMENKSGVTFKANYRIKDNCDMLSCPENSKCTRLNDRLFCHCNEGYTYVRGRCSPLRCAASPCLNGGTCIENLRKNIHCKCSQYYGGQFCQIDLLCNDHTCSFGNGVCIHVDGKPHCACKPEFTGESCQFKILGNILPHFQILNSRTDLQYSHECVNESIEIFTLWGKLLYRICLIQPKRQLYINYSSIRISVKMKAASNSVVLARIFTVDNLSTRAAVVCSNQSYCFNKELDLCSEMQCNGGHCVSTNNTYAACKCPAGYAGSYCEEKIKTCEAMPCKNGGSCLPRRNGYLCKCTKQFYGVNCEKRMCSHLIVDTPSGVIKSPHFPSNYPDNSECSWKIVTNPDSLIWLRFLLLDIEGIPGQCHFDVVKIYNGENSASELLSSDCGYKTETTPPIKLDIVKNIVTVNFVTDSSVNSRGFMLLWNITSSLCRNVKCPLHSVCELGVNGTPICTCDFGYYGEKCEEVDHCLYVTCANGGTCKTHGNSFHCICSSGITGLLCDEDIDECIENPCKNKGICVNNYAWIIAPEKYNRYAQLNPLLVDLINGEKIQIFDGNYWNISHDVQLIAEFDKDVEALFPVRAYQNWLSVFFWTTGTFLPEKKLIFDAFLTSSESPPGCQDRDCKYPILTSFEICKVKRLGLPWLKLFHWELRRDSECATTIFFGQKKLVNITFNANRCLNHSCPPHSSCVSYPESYHCRCDKGYAGFDCQEAIDQCSSSPCVLGHGMCANKPDGSFVCRCKEGYTGKHCEHDLICPLNYCQHKGRCERESGKPRCICKGPFSGPRCEQASCGETTVSYFYIFESMNHPEPYPPSLDCKWTITTKNVGSYVDLECGWDYVKIQLSNDEIITLCQAKKKTVYSDNSTLNMWFHSDSSKSGKGFYITAEAIINPCVKQPCGNNFICQVTGPNSRECICEPGYTGKECDEIIDICADVDCKNGGSCYADKLNFTCVCRKGYRGKFCEIQSNPCIPNPCGHFGICKQVDIAKHTCSCILPASGNSCRIEYKIIISHSGVIKSPEYPFSYPNEMQCDWLLYSILDAGSDFDFCSKFPCKNDGICENSIALKEARSRSCQCRSKAYHGFSCETRRYFKCGQLLESKPSLSGIVATPDFPLPYNSSYCKWPIQVPKDHIIEITFTTLETYRNCSKCCTGADQVSLEDQNGHIISKFCGHALPPIFTVQSDHVVVVFNAKQTSNTGIGFHLLYRAVQNVCFNDKYCLTNQSCVIDRYGKPFCICPFGYEGRYCTEREFVKIMQRLGDVDVEKDIQGVYMTGATNLNVKMGEHVYIPKVDLYAFALMKQLDTKCGGIIRRPLIGTITSPKNFSTNYYFKGTDCEWEFIAPEGTCVHLKFYWIDLSCTSYYAAFGMCTPENIKIYNSKNKSLVPLKRLCFEPTTLEVVSLKNNLILSYHSEKDDDFEHYDKDNCFEGACAEQFLCVDQLDDKYKCICKPGFTGKNCDIVFDACASLPSGFCGEGRCVNVGDSFYCECSPGWTGEVCMDEINYCDSSPCIYGTCHSLKNAYYCSCIETYEYYSYGPQCEFVACKSITLSNDHGILQSPFYPEPSPKVADLNAAYCATDYLAIFDQAEISEINEDQPQELICDRLTTKRIEVHSDEFSLLFASGKLNDTISKFYGRYMTVDPSLCTPNPCQNNGNCSIEADGTIICKCPINYYGQLCEKKATVICDAETKEINGTFSVSPDPLYTTCSWTIYNTPVGNKAATEIEIHELYIPNDDCNENFLEIYTKKDYFTEFVLLRKLCSVSNELSSKIMSVDGYAVKLILRSIDVERKFAFSYNFDVCTAKNIICKDTKYCVNTHYGTASYSCLCKPKLTDPTCFSPCQNLKLPGSVGAFNSPGFPHLYPSNVHCSWRIKNRSNSTAIMLTMKYMNIRDNSPYCDDEYIEIHSVSRNHSNLMQKICGKMLDVKFFTMAEEMIIYFHTDVYFGGNGFVATYGIVNNPCIYLMCKNGGFCYIHKPSLQPVCQCRFGYFGLLCEKFRNCPDGYCLNGGVCVSEYKKPYRCSCPKGLQGKRCEIAVCGGIYYTGATLSTPNILSLKLEKLECNYFLETESSAISVQFEKLFFGWQTECKDSYVEIHEGWDQTNSSIIGRYCNNEEMPALIGTQSNNRLFLVVRAVITSDKAANYTFKVREDFKCHYTICPNSDCSQRQNEILCICPPYMTGQLCDIERCGYNVVNESQGIIKSFGSYSYYLGRVHCFYNIKTQPESVMALTNEEELWTEENSLIFFDGKNELYYKMENLQTFLSSTNEISIQFSAVFRSMPTQTYHFEQFGELSTFDPVFAPFRRFFRRYTITVPGFSGILLQILYFNVIDCTKNHVDIYVKEKFVERLCDVPITDEEVSIASDSVTFVANFTRYTDEFLGFSLNYSAFVVNCDNLILHNSSAIITSPRYPDLYMNNLSCLWKIAPNQKGKVVKAILTIDHIEGTMPECNQDFVAVSYLNSRQQEIEIGKYCGKNYTIQLTSATNNLIVKFKSDERITFSGFFLEYTLVRRGCKSFICLNGGTCSDSIFQIFCTCPPGYIGMFCEIDVFCAKHLCQHGATCLMGKCKCAEGFTGQFCENFVNSEQNIFQFPTTIVSPFYPHKYPNDINITWNLISVESGLLLRFKHISLEYSTSCDQNDFVQVSDLNRTIGIFCGSMLPPAIYTTNKYLKIIFHSDSSISMEGFEAFVANSKDPCEMFDCSGHGDCIAENGYVSCKCHKNYSGENCEINNACRDVLCMNSGTCILRKGASICNCRWPFTGATCADVLCGHYFKHIFNGKISFLSLVNSNVSNVDCTWTVEEPENSTISIHINNFQMKYPNEDCNSNFLEIVDRKSTKSTVIAKYCDSKNVTSLLATKTNLLTVRFVSKHAMDDSFAIDFTTDYQGKNICNFYCQNYGKCKIQNQKPICDCPDDLWCSSNPCLNGGTCKHNENNTTYQCSCLKNFNVICGGTLKLWKRFTSPLYPNSYPNLSRCIWTYNDTKRNILLSFTNFQLELTDDCSNDYVAIERCSVVSGCSSILKSRYCGDKRFKILIQLHAFQRNWEWLKITFISDSTESFRGFSAKLLPSDMKILNSSVAE